MMEIMGQTIVLGFLRMRVIRHSLIKGNIEYPLRLKRLTLLSMILNMVETLAPIIMYISNQHCLLSLNSTVQDLIFFSLTVILHMTWTMMSNKRRLIISSSRFLNHMRQTQKGPFHLLKTSLLKMNSLFILKEQTNIQENKRTYENP